MPGIFLGLKFQACVFFWVCNMKLRRTPPSCILRVPPLGCEHTITTPLASSAGNSAAEGRQGTNVRKGSEEELGTSQ